ncbi:hypothetical protein ASC87_29650 [Rhizobacter sp. Root1221]|nr:hypothetical protein ASC87_29650 [Rhizobacter sp. Root1221]
MDNEPLIKVAQPLPTSLFNEQRALWPAQGEHVLAHYDVDSIVVYQAFRESTGRYAIEHQRFGEPDYSLDRMSWIKPNFLWMMYRSGWGTKPGQEVTLGLRIRRSFFDQLLARAVASSFDPACGPSKTEWKAAVLSSEVRLQWDPDHLPDGSRCERRAAQLHPHTERADCEAPRSNPTAVAATMRAVTRQPFA